MVVGESLVVKTCITKIWPGTSWSDWGVSVGKMGIPSALRMIFSCGIFVCSGRTLNNFEMGSVCQKVDGASINHVPYLTCRLTRGYLARVL